MNISFYPQYLTEQKLTECLTEISAGTVRIIGYTNIKDLIKAKLQTILQHYNLYMKWQRVVVKQQTVLPHYKVPMKPGRAQYLGAKR